MASYPLLRDLIIYISRAESYPCTGLDRPLELQQVEASRISSKSVKVVSPKHCPNLPPEDIPGTDFCYRLSHLRVIVRQELLSQWKMPLIPIGQQPRDLPSCSSVPHPTAQSLLKISFVSFIAPTLMCLGSGSINNMHKYSSPQNIQRAEGYEVKAGRILR